LEGIDFMYYLGIDLGGTHIAVGIVDENMNILLKGSTPTNLPRPHIEVMQDIADLSIRVMAETKLDSSNIAWVGVGTPGTANRKTGVVEFSNNIRFNNYPLKEVLEKLINKTVYIENDANCAAYGEYMAGAAKGAESAVVITLGTGVGGGIIVNDTILNGFNFGAGELGHMVIEYNGRPCNCGRNGCWESYSSATALIAMTKEAMLNEKESLMWQLSEGNINKAGGKTSFDAMRAGDKAGSAVVDKYISYLACGLLNVINIFQPEIICIGGGVSKEGDYLLKPLEKIIKKEHYSHNSIQQTKICIAQLGNDAGIVGAAMLGKLEHI
jgi:glucokinase